MARETEDQSQAVWRETMLKLLEQRHTLEHCLGTAKRVVDEYRKVFVTPPAPEK
jgi:GTP cyclohydrolase I